jgi:hypothetical protein
VAWKRAVIVALAGLNLLLVAALVFSTASLPAAYGQARGRPGDYLMTTVQVRENVDALVVINGPANRLFLFVPDLAGRLTLVDGRSLTSDFRKGQ